MRRVWLICLAAPLLAGCGGARVVRVTGPVRYGGKPVAGLFLHFVPENGRPSWGVTDEQGQFKLVNDKKHQGAVLGRHKVYFEYRPRDAKEDMALALGKSPLAAEMKAILAKYGSEATTPLAYEVNQDGQVIDIDLE
jgi:hypothetical protein